MNNKIIKSYSIEMYISADGRIPFKQWLQRLNDKKTIARILHRIDRLESGNLGNCKNIKNGLFELKETFRAGYRIYFSIMEDRIVLILGGSSKARQQAEIEKALERLSDYLARVETQEKRK